MTEVWLPVTEFPDAYEVSSEGRIRTVSRTVIRSNGSPITIPARIRALTVHRGYSLITLMVAGKQHARLVHNIVARAFLGPRPEHLETRHLDGKGTNNALTNLQYGTKSQNTHDSVRHGTHVMSRKTHCKRGHPLSGDNLYLAPDGRGRACRTCQRDNVRARRQAAKQQTAHR